MRVVEIFGSIDGEGKRTGQLTTFIRLAGCNLRCVYCDTTYSFNVNDAADMTIDEILEKCAEIGYHNITLTGGEPLVWSNIKILILCLCEAGYQVNVETNGSISLYALTALRAEKHLDLFFTVDYKTPYSQMSGKMNRDAFNCLDIRKDIVKCVVADVHDMDDALAYLDAMGRFNIWFSPVYGKIEPSEIVDYVKQHKRQDITVQVQLHKIIWDPQKRGV